MDREPLHGRTKSEAPPTHPLRSHPNGPSGKGTCLQGISGDAKKTSIFFAAVLAKVDRTMMGKDECHLVSNTCSN